MHGVEPGGAQTSINGVTLGERARDSVGGRVADAHALPPRPQLLHEVARHRRRRRSIAEASWHQRPATHW